MATANARPVDELQSDLRRGSADAAGLYQGNLNALIATSEAMINGYQSVNAEMLAFAQNRVQEAADMGRRLSNCRSPEGAWEVQMEFAQASLQAWVEELKKLTDMTGKVMNEALSPLAERGGELETATSKAVAA